MNETRLSMCWDLRNPYSRSLCLWVSGTTDFVLKFAWEVYKLWKEFYLFPQVKYASVEFITKQQGENTPSSDLKNFFNFKGTTPRKFLSHGSCSSNVTNSSVRFTPPIHGTMLVYTCNSVQGDSWWCIHRVKTFRVCSYTSWVMFALIWPWILDRFHPFTGHEGP